MAGLMNSVEYACKLPDTGIAAESSPRQVVISHIIRPPTRYITIAPPGPAVAITSPELRNRPVPIVPPTPTMTAELVFIVLFKPVLAAMTLSIDVFFSLIFYLPKIQELNEYSFKLYKAKCVPFFCFFVF